MNEDLSSTIVLTQSAHQIAKNFYRHHKPKQYPKKAKQVYLNTLAVYAVDYYLRHKGFETDWEASYSWNPVMQIFADIGDLLVKNLGKLECRPVLPNKETCYVPPEVWEDRIGYVAVHFNQFLTEAKLLGFLPSVVEEECHLSYFYSLEDLLEYLRRISSPYIPSSMNRAVVHLTEWLRAISKGLQLAIFNSCDGLGLAQNLVEFNIPQLIVMKQPVPDTVAKEFLKYFLEEYASGKSLYLSVRTARERLQGLEDEFPCASWLPIIYQNPLYVPPNWLELSGTADNKKSVKRNQEFMPIQLIDNLKYALNAQKTSKILSVMLVILSVISTSKILIISENIYQELNKIHLFLTDTFEEKNQEISQASVLNSRLKKPTMKLFKFKQSSNSNFEQVILSKLKPDKDKSDELDESTVSVGIDKANGTVKLFDICTGSELKTLQGRSGSVLSVSFNPDGKKIASASNDEIIRLWSVEGKERKTLVVSRGIDRSIAQGKPEPISRSQGEVIETRTSSPIQQFDIDLANCHDNLSSWTELIK